VSAFDGQALGLCVVGLGGGRQVESDIVDPAVGLSDVVPLGAKVAKGDPILKIHAAREDQADLAAEQVLAAITIAKKPAEALPLIYERIDA
jgi:thymidine phosphorylase